MPDEMRAPRPDDIREKYNKIDDIWSPDDRWHRLTRERIEAFIRTELPKTGRKSIRILNAGSGGNAYGLEGDNHVHVDIAERHLNQVPNKIVANIENIPVDSSGFDVCICVGSVLNYCDAAKTLQEFSRILRTGGILILEYEKSRSFDFLFRPWFNQQSALAETFYGPSKETLWVYSEGYINQLLTTNKFRIINSKRFHILSPLILRVTGSATFASSFIIYDQICSRIPFLRTFSSNLILSCLRVT